MATQYLSKTGLTYLWGRIVALYQPKEAGKGLSTNDYTDADKAEVAKIAGLVATGGEPNTIATVKLDGTALTPDAQKAVNIPFTIARDYEEKKTTFTFGGSSGNSLVIKRNNNIAAGYAYDFTEIDHDSGADWTVTLASLDYVDAKVPVKSVKANGTALTPDAQGAVDVRTATASVTATGTGADMVPGAAVINNAANDQHINITATANGYNLTLANENIAEPGTIQISKAIPDEARVNALITAALAEGIGGVTQFRYLPVDALPATGEAGVIYLVPNSGNAPNIKDEYIWINKGTAEAPDYAFELLGTTEMDLSGYLQTTDVEAITTAEIDEITGAATP